MSKYKDKDGFSLNIGNMTQEGRDGNGITLIQEVISETTNMLEQKNYSHRDQVLGIDYTHRAINFLKENFDIE